MYGLFHFFQYSKRYCIGVWLHEMYSSSENNNQANKIENSAEQSQVLSKSDEEFKKVLLSQLIPNSSLIYTNDVTEITYENAIKIARLLSLAKDLQCFELYLSRICKVCSKYLLHFY